MTHPTPLAAVKNDKQKLKPGFLNKQRVQERVKIKEIMSMKRIE